MILVVLVFWGEYPSIVFDQGALDIWGHDSLLDEDATFDSFEISKPFTAINDWDTVLESNLDAIPDLNINTLCQKELDAGMNSSDRPRKSSVSDIIDVLPLQENRILNENIEADPDLIYQTDVINHTKLSKSRSHQKQNKKFFQQYKPYVHTNVGICAIEFNCSTFPDDENQDLASSAISSLDNHLSLKQNAILIDNALALKIHKEQTNSTSVNEKQNVIDAILHSQTDNSFQSDSQSTCSDSDSFTTNNQGKAITFNMNVLLNLLSSPGNAVILICDDNNEISCISGSTKDFQSHIDSKEKEKKFEGFEVCDPCYDGNTNMVALQAQFCNSKPTPLQFFKKVDGKPRGRKRIHQPDKPDDVRKDKRRERNNEASKVVRHKRKVRRLMLFEKESSLIKQNLTLKTQLMSLEKEIKLMREKLGIKTFTSLKVSK